MSESRRRTPSDEIVSSLVNAAVRIIESEGVDALTIRRVANEAGVSPQSVYNHFENKHGLLDAVFRLGFDRMQEIYKDLPRHDPTLALRESGRRYRVFALRSPGFYTVMMGSPIPGWEPRLESRLYAAMSFGTFVEIIEECIEAGYIRKDNPINVAQQMWMITHGAISLEMRGMAFVEDPEAFYEDVLDTSYQGLATEKIDDEKLAEIRSYRDPEWRERSTVHAFPVPEADAPEVGDGGSDGEAADAPE